MRTAKASPTNAVRADFPPVAVEGHFPGARRYMAEALKRFASADRTTCDFRANLSHADIGSRRLARLRLPPN